MREVNTTGSTLPPEDLDKDKAEKQLDKLKKELVELQDVFYAARSHALLIVLQGMDTAGKDGTVKHVFSCVNPQGCNVKAFKVPTEEEKEHDFLWRIYPHLPAKGMFEIFNRSHYEDVLHLAAQSGNDREIALRCETINHFEQHLLNSQTIVLKFYLHISKEEQQQRIQSRLDDPLKSWKYDISDTQDAARWDQYMQAYQTILSQCSLVPWTIVPADKKWYRNYVVAHELVKTLKALKLEYPGRKS